MISKTESIDLIQQTGLNGKSEIQKKFNLNITVFVVL